jgi:fatty-acyl-CoA synthase
MTESNNIEWRSTGFGASLVVSAPTRIPSPEMTAEAQPLAEHWHIPAMARTEAGVPGYYADSSTTWGEIFNHQARKYPEHEAIVFGDRRVTYADFLQQVNLLAKGLLQIGVRKGDQVAIWMTNNTECLVCQFAIYKIGARLVPINTRFRTNELEYVLHQSDTTTLFLRDVFLGGKINALDIIYGLFPELEGCRPGQLSAEKCPRLRNLICSSNQRYKGIFSFREIMEAGEKISGQELEDIEAGVTPDDLLHIVYTSGTTGFPKGVMHTHRNYIVSIHILADILGLTPEDRVLLGSPFIANIGLYGVLSAICRGATVTFAETFDALEALKIIDEEKVTTMFGTPSMLIMILQHPEFDKYDVSSLKKGLVAGAPVPMELMKRLSELEIGGMMNIYGLVENGLVSATAPWDSNERIVSTVGRVAPHCRVKIVDPDSGSELPAGQQGEICTRGLYPHTSEMVGYYKNPEETSKTIDTEGWLHTGDLGVLDEEGYLHITGRLKDMLIVGGFNVASVEVEDFLYTNPKVKQVAVVGVPDARLGEVPAAYIELKEGHQATEQEIMDFCKNGIASYKVPRYVRFIGAGEFPMTASGKIQKVVLQERAVKDLGLTRGTS